MDALSDRYELRGTLGVGGMAEVREAYDRLLDRRVAVKLLRPDLGRDPKVRERFLREARTAAQFTHPNAVTVFDTGVADSRPFIVMELIEGPTLADRLSAEGALPENEATSIAEAVLAALGAAHREGFVHRDVKPGNILLPHAGGVKLADFGIAKGVQDAAAGLTATGTIIGTPAYLSPEQVNGESATPASDVYAVGVVLYEMLTGVQPFTGDTPVAVAVAHTTRPAPSLRDTHPTVSAHLADVVKRAMAKDPAQRFTDADAMRSALKGRTPEGTLLAGAAAATTQVVKQRPFRRQRRTPVLPLALVALLLLGGLALALANANAPQQRRENAAATERPREQQADQGAQDPSPTEPEATEAAPAAEPPPDPRDAGGDILQLISILEENPEAYGQRQDEVLKRLIELTQQDDEEKRSEEATKLIEQVQAWEAEASISSELAEAVYAAVTPFVVESDEEEDRGPPAGRGNGNGEGNGKGKDDD